MAHFRDHPSSGGTCAVVLGRFRVLFFAVAPDRRVCCRRWARAMIRARMRSPRQTTSLSSSECDRDAASCAAAGLETVSRPSFDGFCLLALLIPFLQWFPISAVQSGPIERVENDERLSEPLHIGVFQSHAGRGSCPCRLRPLLSSVSGQEVGHNPL